MSEQAQRKLLHTRSVECRGYQLDGGLWEIEGRMRDLKSFPMENEDRGGIAVGEPLHDIALTLTLDRTLLIHRVEATIDASPFRQCPRITGAFKVLEGMRLKSGFTREARDKLGGVNGCTHLLELLGPIATTAFQTLWQSENGYSGDDPGVINAIVDTCHTLARDGEVMQRVLPQSAGGDPSKTEPGKGFGT
ncbi:DUF2889 domain-containing protein [Marinobacterium sp. YM272]|uniref:DUF2889 domain-containing protein n=1 Tax=Marinobacterium sp. YM272 TaxID=3421654 RepID=UPI003D7FD28A